MGRSLSNVAAVAAATALLLGETCDGHGVLLKPISRSLFLMTNTTDGLQFAGECPGGIACQWYTQRTTIPGEATNCDEELRTMGVNCGDDNPTDFPCTSGQAVPWCAPGTAPVESACGIFSGGLQFGLEGGTNGRDMRDLPSAPIVEESSWVAGTNVEVAWAITANHGGGYAYRLCPIDNDTAESLSEECFQSHHLSFSGTTQKIVDPEGNLVSEAPLVWTSKGTHPEGSQWARNPFPMEEGVIDPIPNLPDAFGRGPFNYSVVDEVALPADLNPGRYVLSWRWDAEQTKQVWSQCSDVEIAAKDGHASPTAPHASSLSSSSSSPPLPSSAAAPHAALRQMQQTLPSGARNLCVADSLGLDVGDCDAWVALYDALNGDSWPNSWRAGCGVDTASGESLMRTNPCGCNAFWQKSVVCSDARNLKRITEIYLLGPEVQGSLTAAAVAAASADGPRAGSRGASSPSPFLGNFTALTALSLVGTNITGTLPGDLFSDLSALQMVWLDHNPSLGGAIPQSLSALPGGQITAFELHGSGFGGALPDNVNWADIPDCTLNGLIFDCPLPSGAETCGAACA